MRTHPRRNGSTLTRVVIPIVGLSLGGIVVSFIIYEMASGRLVRPLEPNLPSFGIFGALVTGAFIIIICAGYVLKVGHIDRIEFRMEGMLYQREKWSNGDVITRSFVSWADIPMIFTNEDELRIPPVIFFLAEGELKGTQPERTEISGLNWGELYLKGINLVRDGRWFYTQAYRHLCTLHPEYCQQ